MRKSTLAALLGGVVLMQAAAWGDVKLPAILSDNMVVQAGKPVRIWGTADKEEKVTVSLGGQSATATAGADGRWKVELKEVAAADGALVMTVEGANKLTVKNILVGSVWIASGQSNMEFGLGGAHNAATEIPKATYPKLRLFTVSKKVAAEPQSDCAGQWAECTPETARAFSAVGYFFGRHLQVATDKPVGMIHTSWGGTPAQAWTSLEGLEKDAGLKTAYGDGVRQRLATYPERKAQYQKDLAAFQEAFKQWRAEHGTKADAMQKSWQDAATAAQAAGKAAPPRPQYAPAAPKGPDLPEGGPGTPATLYNGMLAPLVGLSIEGAIWYQGESNAGNAAQYRTLFPAMITDWRAKFGQGDFPFLFVQLANFMKRPSEPVDTGWARLREAQRLTLALPKTGMAVAIDIGQSDNIHPRDKMDVGHRLFLAAQRVALGKEVVLSPLYKDMKVEEGKIRVNFKDIGTGLTIGAAPATQPGVEAAKPAAEVKGFAIAGEDHKFVWAQAKIDGASVVVWSDKVAKPVAVRYAWADDPECNLYNKEGLPASPFRTDEWEMGK